MRCRCNRRCGANLCLGLTYIPAKVRIRYESMVLIPPGYSTLHGLFAGARGRSSACRNMFYFSPERMSRRIRNSSKPGLELVPSIICSYTLCRRKSQLTPFVMIASRASGERRHGGGENDVVLVHSAQCQSMMSSSFPISVICIQIIMLNSNEGLF